jgi:hypothetical protein
MPSAARCGAILLSIFVSACASNGPARAPAAAAPPPDPAARQRLVAAETLCQQLAADPQLAPLRGRLIAPEPTVPWTRAMMIDPSYVNERDRALLVVLDTRRAECRRALIGASPGQAVPFLDYWQRQDAALVRLYNREIPVGTYNRTMADAQAQFTIEVSNQQTDTAVRANQPHTDTTPSDSSAPRRSDAPSALPLESFRALGVR